MSETDGTLFDRRMRDSVESIRRALARIAVDAPPGDMPSGEETRELLGLFARLPSDELRQAMLGLMRAIVERGMEPR